VAEGDVGARGGVGGGGGPEPDDQEDDGGAGEESGRREEAVQSSPGAAGWPFGAQSVQRWGVRDQNGAIDFELALLGKHCRERRPAAWRASTGRMLIAKMSYELTRGSQWPASPRSCCGPYRGRMRALMVHLRAACQGPKWRLSAADHTHPPLRNELVGGRLWSAAESWCGRGKRHGGCAPVGSEGTDGSSGWRNRWAGIVEGPWQRNVERRQRGERGRSSGQGRLGRGGRARVRRFAAAGRAEGHREPR
jgi:hypothetical protein